MNRSSRTVPIAVFAAFVALFVTVRARRTDALDLAISLRIQGARHPGFRRAMGAVSWLGFPPQSQVIPPTVAVAAAVLDRPVTAAYLLAAWSGAAISSALKALVDRPRPLPSAVDVVVAPLGGTSFPSGHVLTYVTFYGFLAHLLATHGRPGIGRRGAATGLVILIALVGPSRVEQGHHWATDVVASYLVGTGVLLVLIQVHDRRVGP